MLKRHVLVAGFVIPFSFSATAETFQAPLVEQSLLLDADTEAMHVVVGERGHVIISEELSQSFTQKSLPLSVTLTSVEVMNDKIWVAGHDATIMFSSDKGETWSVQMHEPELQRPFLDILFFDEQHGIASGAYGLFYRTIDGGENWTQEQHITLLNPLDIEYLEEIREEDEAFYRDELNSILPHINRLNYSNGVLYSAGETGLLAKSTDDGENWERFEIDYFGSFFDILPIDDDTLFAVGLRGTLYLKEGDTEWQRIESCTTATLNSAVFMSSGNVLVVGNNGAILTVEVSQLSNQADTCQGNGITVAQLPAKSAIATVLKNDEAFTAVTSDGLQPLEME